MDESIRFMPKCALCDKQAWRWVKDFDPDLGHFQAALCETHSPNGAAQYTLGALEDVRRRMKESASCS